MKIMQQGSPGASVRHSKMTNSSPRRVRSIKPDPDDRSLSSSSHGHRRKTQVNETTPGSIYSATSVAAPPVDSSFYHQNRSDAPPPPSEIPPSESEPLLREVRARTNMAIKEHQPQDDSFFHSSFRDIGKKLKECNDTLGELQQLGVSHDVQLPELVLVGDQSAGKSSLMSGVAHIDLPRSEGTCTRCPLHIRVSRNSEYSCRVSLRKEYLYDPPSDGRILESDVTGNDPFFPWKKKQNVDILEFKTMPDSKEIELVLRWAQVAILNDSQNHKLFIPHEGATAINTSIENAETQAKFSPNVVALEIKGPHHPDLSFYDMPGIFQNPKDASDDYLVRVVHNLASTYIQHPSAIIICSMPMNTDPENSSTFGLIRRLQATQRTIGVLTKADLLPKGGNHEQWLAIMNGTAHCTGRGYFITSRPQGKDLEDLKAWEERLFTDKSTEVWPDAFHSFEDRCGVEKLKDFLSARLSQEFAKSLPTIKNKLKHHLADITMSLASLPELPSNVELEVKSCLNDFAEKSRSALDKFRQTINVLPKDFTRCLLEMKPKFTLRDQSDIPIHVISDDESDAASVATASISTPSTNKRRNEMSFSTPTKRSRLDIQSVNHSQPGNSVPRENGTPNPRLSRRPPPLPEPFTKFSGVGSGFRTLAQVREEIGSKMTAGVPDIIPSTVYEDLAIAAIRPWNEPTQVFLAEATRRLAIELRGALKQAMGKLEKRSIYKATLKHIETCLEQYRCEAEDGLNRHYSDETKQLLTFNTEAFSQHLESERALLIRFRHHMRMAANNAPQAPLIPIESMSREKLAQEAKQRDIDLLKLGKDSFSREVEVVAYVRGYYRLAAHRYADNVAQILICRMIPNLQRELPDYVKLKLGIYGSDSQRLYESLMAEDHRTAHQRQILKAKKEKFEMALTSIESLESSSFEGYESFMTQSMSGTMQDHAFLHDTQMTNDASEMGEA